MIFEQLLLCVTWAQKLDRNEKKKFRNTELTFYYYFEKYMVKKKKLISAIVLLYLEYIERVRNYC